MLRDRENMKNDGLVIIILALDNKRNTIVKPSVYARGFNTGAETHVIRHAQMHAQEALEACLAKRESVFDIKNNIKHEVSKYIHRKTERNPMVVVALMDEAK